MCVCNIPANYEKGVLKTVGGVDSTTYELFFQYVCGRKLSYAEICQNHSFSALNFLMQIFNISAIHTPAKN